MQCFLLFEKPTVMYLYDLLNRGGVCIFKRFIQVELGESELSNEVQFVLDAK